MHTRFPFLTATSMNKSPIPRYPKETTANKEATANGRISGAYKGATETLEKREQREKGVRTNKQRTANNEERGRELRMEYSTWTTETGSRKTKPRESTRVNCDERPRPVYACAHFFRMLSYRVRCFYVWLFVFYSAAFCRLSPCGMPPLALRSSRE